MNKEDYYRAFDPYSEDYAAWTNKALNEGTFFTGGRISGGGRNPSRFRSVALVSEAQKLIEDHSSQFIAGRTDNMIIYIRKFGIKGVETGFGNIYFLIALHGRAYGYGSCKGGEVKGLTVSYSRDVKSSPLHLFPSKFYSEFPNHWVLGFSTLHNPELKSYSLIETHALHMGISLGM